MPNKEPKIAFIFPYRWVIEDKEYFPENVRRQVTSFVGGADGIDLLLPVLVYSVNITYQHTKPVKIPLTQAEVQKMLKPLFPNARCIGLETKYIQTEAKKRLPILDFQIFF